MMAAVNIRKYIIVQFSPVYYHLVRILSMHAIIYPHVMQVRTRNPCWCKREQATAAVHVWNPSKTKSVTRGRRTTSGYSVCSVILILTVLVRSNPLRIYGFWNYSLPGSCEDLVILACTIFDWSTRVTDEQTDRWTDRIVMAKTCYSSSCCCT